MNKKGFSGRTLAGLLLLNLVVHFIPFERPGFQPDDFVWQNLARVPPPWSFVERSLGQPTRPLDWLLYIVMPALVGLNEVTQIAILVASTSALTALVYAFLAGVLPRSLANLATLAFVAWPVKHEIYASQLFAVITFASMLIVGSGLAYRKWVHSGSRPALALAVAFYGVSIFTYEIGYAAPLVFLLIDRPRRERLSSLTWFLIPAGLYWAVRFGNGLETERVLGRHELEPGLLVFNLATSLPSNLFGFQLARNVAYGFWSFICGPLWLQAAGLGVAVFGGILSARWIRESRHEAVVDRWVVNAGKALLCAALLALPSAMVLVESRHSVLAAAGMAVAISMVSARAHPAAGATLIAVLLLASQGLALRQTEASRMQAAVHEVIVQRRDEIRSASVVVFDIESLARRAPYTWGETRKNVFRSYWGIHAFSDWGFRAMVGDVLSEEGPLRPKVVTCSAGLRVLQTTVSCDRDYRDQKPFVVDREGALIIEFATIPLP